MKITQEKEFKPVTITLETKEEYEYLWSFIEDFHQEDDWPSDRRSFIVKLCDRLGELNG